MQLTLSVLLADELGLSLGVHKARPKWGSKGEVRLSRWMNEYARIALAVYPTPCVVEHEVLANGTLALNVKGCSDAFSKELTARRTAARRAARAAG